MHLCVLQRSNVTVARLYNVKENTREGINSERRRERGRKTKEMDLFVLGVATTIAMQPCQSVVIDAEHYNHAIGLQTNSRDGNITPRHFNISLATCHPRCGLCNKRRTKLHQFVSFESAQWCCWLEKGRYPRHFAGRSPYDLELRSHPSGCCFSCYTVSCVCQPISGFFLAMCSAHALKLPVHSPYNIYVVVRTTSVTFIPPVCIRL